MATGKFNTTFGISTHNYIENDAYFTHTGGSSAMIPSGMRNDKAEIVSEGFTRRRRKAKKNRGQALRFVRFSIQTL